MKFVMMDMPNEIKVAIPVDEDELVEERLLIMLHLIVKLTDSSMSRMEAWKAVTAEVPQLDWESFKRIQPLAERKRK